ncbi:MAG: hypothetical protein A2Y84_00995 [Candidatus Colwellbacteria bacterium RBG_13_48_8]|uniref:DUF4258 domain-containing protein n=1 Tax=Candidatus Colwellbacteria bacterium RBG_13_48_8 TaxID=1797685 RepID=A0A1G1YV87_9BACT|nr:MAG: hypothetical protein A2Y84_00995 [Candidatus Colwellbacteria bacterium RBG_13_48_8]
MRDLFWTNHAQAKMHYYRLSEARVKRVIKSPERVEEGIAEKTIALMQLAGTHKRKHEIWVMVADTPKKRRVVSAWRYPGRTKPGEPLPEGIMKEFREAGYGTSWVK